MSHHLVAVLTEKPGPEEVARLLEPYNENTTDKQYLEFEDCTAECREGYEDIAEPYGVPFKAFMEFEDFVSEYYGCEIVDGKAGMWTNPNGKWDWYETGGRWCGNLRLKPGATGWHGKPSTLGIMTGEQTMPGEEEFDAAKVEDIDFDAMEAVRLRELTPYEQAREDTFPGPEFFNQQYPTKDDYIIKWTKFHTLAVITPDGKWHGSGNPWTMLTTDYIKSYKDNFIKPAIENGWYMTIVDCHN